MNVAIVGSRTFPQPKLIEWFIRDLPIGVNIVSGGAKGVDTIAADCARQRGLKVIEYRPDLAGCREPYEFTKRYYERNQRIVNTADLIVAFTEKNAGGTWNTIIQARKAGKPLKIIRPSLFFSGADINSGDPVQDGAKSPQQIGRDAVKGKGPFALKRVSLGSYALRRYSYIEPEEWAAIVADKEADPVRLAARMVPAFVDFFTRNRKFGIVHAVTPPPRSKRHLDRVHVMDFVTDAVSREIGVESVRLFEPWEKSTRGRHAKRGEIAITPEAARMVGKVVWVLDDVSTTNFTLQSAVQGLMAIEIHAHGLAWVYMA
jgi:hypothetical protein